VIIFSPRRGYKNSYALSLPINHGIAGDQFNPARAFVPILTVTIMHIQIKIVMKNTQVVLMETN